jgi:hypothetical protein
MYTCRRVAEQMLLLEDGSAAGAADGSGHAAAAGVMG